MNTLFLNPLNFKWAKALLPCFIVLSLLYSFSAAAQDTLFLANQDTLLVYVEEVAEDYVRFSMKTDSGDSRMFMLDRDKIRAISIQEASPYVDYGEEGGDILVDIPKKPKDTTNYRGNGLFVNLLGNGAGISLHYEHPLFRKEAIFVTGSVGVGKGIEWFSIDIPNIQLGGSGNTSPPPSNPPPDPDVPVLFNTQIHSGYGRKSVLFILGFGLTAAYAGDAPAQYYPYPLVGLAVRPTGKKVFFRLYASTPFARSNPENFDWVPVGINIGGVF